MTIANCHCHYDGQPFNWVGPIMVEREGVMMSEFITRLRDADPWLSLTKEQRSGIEQTALAYERDVQLAALRYVCQRILAGTHEPGYVYGAIEQSSYVEGRWGVLHRTADDPLTQELVAVRNLLLDYVNGKVERAAIQDMYINRAPEPYVKRAKAAAVADEDDLDWDDDDDDADWESV